MKLFGVGNALLYFRKSKNLSQEQLCDGICSVTTLSRIEKGNREYDSLISDTLLSRLGKTAERFEFVLNEEDYKLYEMREQIEQKIKDKKTEEAEILITEYKKLMPEEELLHQQFILYHEVMLLKLKNENEEKIRTLLHEAIDMTRPDYMEDSSIMKLYSHIEVNIIYQLFLYEQYEEEQLLPLLSFMSNYYDEEEQERNLIPFLYKLVYIYEEKENYREVINIAEKAIDIMGNGMSYRYLADFYFQKLKGEEKLYSESMEWKDRRAEKIEMCNKLYYLYMIEKNQEKMEQVEIFCKEKMQCQITT